MRRQLFKKGYVGNWSEEIFEIDARLPTVPVTYRLKDLVGDTIKGKFYEPEIQKVDKSDEDYFDVEKILKNIYNHIYVKYVYTQNKSHAGAIQTNARVVCRVTSRAVRTDSTTESQPLLVEFSYESDSEKVKMTYLASAPRRVQVEESNI